MDPIFAGDAGGEAVALVEVDKHDPAECGALRKPTWVEGRVRMGLDERSKKMRWRIAVVLVALLAAPLVMAQNRVIADIPFPFIVSGRTHAVGEWTLVKVGTGTAPMWLLRDNEGRNAALLVANPAYKQLDAETRLTFNRYGSQYFLSEIWLPGEVGYYLLPSKQEKALRLAGVKPERTVMFARVR